MLGHPPDRGFTLVELMIVLAVLAIILGIGMPSFSLWMENNRIRNAAESIISGLHLARSEAVSRNSLVQFRLVTGSAWTVGCVNAMAGCPATIQSRSIGDGSSASVTVDADGEDTFVFDGFGRMAAPVPTGGATTIAIAVDSSVLDASRSRDLRITASPGGGVRLCDPNISSTGDPRRCP